MSARREVFSHVKKSALAPGDQTHAAMNRVAWLSYALLALAHGRIYERCDLARELMGFGVDPEDVATWVCIAYHESRFDTSANNPYSGDHGIFQISELYWCGPGKACGLSCSLLRDEDISNDLQCALEIHKEHTRLQGNGFLAWVVYPQHCKHNTKKYLVDCDVSAKNSVPITKSRAYTYENRYFPNYNYIQRNVESLLPPYLSIGNIIRANYGKVLDLNRNKVDWYNYKLNNIDDLKLLTSFIKQPQQVTSAPSTTTTQETTEYIPPVVPWRTIESNQFRHKKIFTTETQPTSRTIFTPVNLNSTSSYFTPSGGKIITSTTAPTALEFTTTRKTAEAYAVKNAISSRITYKWRPTTLATPSNVITTQSPLFSPNLRLSNNNALLTYPGSTVLTTKEKNFVPITKFTASNVKSPSKSWYSPPSTYVTRTSTPTTFRWPAPDWITPIPTATLLASPPPSVLPIERKPTRTTTHPKITTTSMTTNKFKPDFQFYTSASRYGSTTTSPVTTKLQPGIQSTTSRPFISFTTSTMATKVQTTTQKSRPTQSIFDLYLHPTKPPKLPSSRHLLVAQNRSSVKIFANGTTTPAPSYVFPKSPRGIRLNDKLDMP